MNIDKTKIQNLMEITKDLKLLYVEDNEEARNQMIKILKNFFQNIDIAIDGKEGLEKYKANHYDLIITDINMPKLNGLEMSDEILKLNKDKHIIIISAYNDIKYLQECIDVGITNYLHKPVKLEQLVNILEKATKTIVQKNRIKDLNKQVNLLLNNAQEGFLAFDKNFICKSGFSKECLNIFNTDTIENKNITELLFEDNKKAKDIFIKGIHNTFESQDLSQKELFLSILPNEQEIHGKIINISYKILPDENIMLILRDITSQKNLQKKLELNNKIRDMIVAVASHKDDFMDLKNDFSSFLKSPPKEKDEIKRKLHTFKGNFAQKNMIYIVDALHQAESDFEEGKDIGHIVKNLDQIFKKDLELITENLNKNFFNQKDKLNIDKKVLDDIELKIKLFDFSLDTEKNRQEILSYIQRLKYINLYEMISVYQNHIEYFAKKFEKLVHPLEIHIDKDLTVPAKFKPFIKSLIHIFNNSIEHGIEDIETRLKKGKLEFGSIKCYAKLLNNLLVIEIEDDGEGLNIDKILQKAKIPEEQSSSLTKEEIYSFIFQKNFTTKENVSKTSGRGIGMNSVKQELDRLDGYHYIISEKDKGCKFEFVIPLENKQNFIKNAQKDILDTVVFQAIKLLKENSGTEDISTQIIDFDSISNDITLTQIFFHKGYEGRCILGFSKEIISVFKSLFIPEGFTPEEEQEMIDDLRKELTNTIVGLSIADIPKDIGSLEISTPEYIKKADIQNINNSVIKKISTTKGEIFCAVTYENFSKTKEIVHDKCFNS